MTARSESGEARSQENVDDPSNREIVPVDGEQNVSLCFINKFFFY